MRKTIPCMLAAVLLFSCSDGSEKPFRDFYEAIEIKADQGERAEKSLVAVAETFSGFAREPGGNMAGNAFNASQAWYEAGDRDRAAVYALLARLGNPRDAKIKSWHEALRKDSGGNPEKENLAWYGCFLLGRDLASLPVFLLAAILANLGFFSLALRGRYRILKPLGISATAAFTVILAASVSGTILDFLSPEVILTAQAELREGDSSGFPTTGETVANGTPAKIIENRIGWSKIRTCTGLTGWIRSDSLARLSGYVQAGSP